MSKGSKGGSLVVLHEEGAIQVHPAGRGLGLGRGPHGDLGEPDGGCEDLRSLTRSSHFTKSSCEFEVVKAQGEQHQHSTSRCPRHDSQVVNLKRPTRYNPEL